SSSHITIYMADATSSTGYSRVNSVSSSAVVVAQDPYYGGAVEGEVNLYFSSETAAQPSEEPSQSVPESSETSETSESSSSSSSTEESSEASTEMQQ
ncbi:MAG: serine/threonine protein kinase, partial [Streptococcus sp.]|nr:serine/threonine protein kinase [Streptococcus sp.]